MRHKLNDIHPHQGWVAARAAYGPKENWETVNNITFRDAYMHHTYKGIYMKFTGNGGTMKNIVYENIVMDEPE